jgi:hypothetical protein
MLQTNPVLLYPTLLSTDSASASVPLAGTGTHCSTVLVLEPLPKSMTTAT